MAARLARLPRRADSKPPVAQSPSETVPELVDKARSLEVAGHQRAALASLEESLAVRPRNLRLLTEKANLLTRMGHWEGAAATWTRLVTHRSRALRPRHWAHAVTAQRRLGRPAAAEGVLAQAFTHFPDDPTLHRHAAELAMAREDWETATDCWAAHLGARVSVAPEVRVDFPARTVTSDWYAAAWHHVAENLQQRGLPRQAPFTAGFYLALARVLVAAGLTHDARRLVEARLSTPAGTPPATDADIDAEDEVALGHLLRSIGFLETDELTRAPSTDALPLLATLPAPPEPAETLGPLRLLRVRAGSAAELSLREARFVNEVTLARHVRRLARADGWPDAAVDVDRLAQRARRWSDAYAATYAVEPHLPVSTLSDAMYLTIYHEAGHLAPMRRLADELAAADSSVPVVIEVTDLVFRYLSTVEDHFGLLYLYFALLQRGVNVFLCRFESDTTLKETAEISFRPGWGMGRRSTVIADDASSVLHRRRSRVALVPAGIRAFPDVASRFPGASVYESGSVVGEFAYDRLHPKTQAIRATTPLHPHAQVLPRFDHPMTRARLSGPGTGDLVLEETRPIGGTWAEWLHRVTSDFVEHVALAAEEDVRRRHVVEANVADYLLPEGVIVGDAVHRAGGRVVLHPHSSNPVHHEVRRPESFDEVEAVTLTGALRWRQAFPDKKVRHVSRSVLVTAGSEAREFTAGQPLSVVLFAGTAVMGRTPWIDLDRHEAAYVALFDGLDALQRTHPVEVYFKPRGATGETEDWLFRVVGHRARWRPTYTHASRLDLPNQVFVSISVGTTALFEGLLAGTPGMIVRDFPVRDYTTLTGPEFPVLDHTEGLDLLAGLGTAAGYAALVDREMTYVRAQLDLPPSP